jgi:hypothetical protein
MVAITTRITVGEHEGLVGVQGVWAFGFPVSGVPVELEEDTREGNGEVGVSASARVGAGGKECDVGFVVGGVEVLAVPAGGEVNLTPNSTRAANTDGQLVIPRAGTIEVEAEERNGLLCEGRGVVGAEGRGAGDHAEVIRESGC